MQFHKTRKSTRLENLKSPRCLSTTLQLGGVLTYLLLYVDSIAANSCTASLFTRDHVPMLARVSTKPRQHPRVTNLDH
jgi:hypothetical protein